MGTWLVLTKSARPAQTWRSSSLTLIFEARCRGTNETCQFTCLKHLDVVHFS
jgi:hypothetical protein